MSASSARTSNTTRSTRRRFETAHAVSVRPVRTAADHRSTLAQIEGLMGARKGTPDGDRLDILTTLIEAWEAPLTLPMIRALSHMLDLPADVLVRQYRLRVAA